MRGEMTIVRDFQGRALVRRVWALNSGTVYICSEENFQRLAAGLEGWSPVGFPRQDVFCYDPNMAQEVAEAGELGPSAWSRLAPWEAQGAG